MLFRSISAAFGMIYKYGIFVIGCLLVVSVRETVPGAILCPNPQGENGNLTVYPTEARNTFELLRSVCYQSYGWLCHAYIHFVEWMELCEVRSLHGFALVIGAWAGVNYALFGCLPRVCIWLMRVGVELHSKIDRERHFIVSLGGVGCAFAIGAALTQLSYPTLALFAALLYPVFRAVLDDGLRVSTTFSLSRVIEENEELVEPSPMCIKTPEVPTGRSTFRIESPSLPGTMVVYRKGPAGEWMENGNATLVIHKGVNYVLLSCHQIQLADMDELGFSSTSCTRIVSDPQARVIISNAEPVYDCAILRVAPRLGAVLGVSSAKVSTSRALVGPCVMQYCIHSQVTEGRGNYIRDPKRSYGKHDITTYPGSSGSALFTKEQGGYRVLAVHTGGHRASKINYFCDIRPLFKEGVVVNMKQMETTYLEDLPDDALFFKTARGEYYADYFEADDGLYLPKKYKTWNEEDESSDAYVPNQDFDKSEENRGKEGIPRPKAPPVVKATMEKEQVSVVVKKAMMDKEQVSVTTQKSPVVKATMETEFQSVSRVTMETESVCKSVVSKVPAAPVVSKSCETTDSDFQSAPVVGGDKMKEARLLLRDMTPEEQRRILQSCSDRLGLTLGKRSESEKPKKLESSTTSRKDKTSTERSSQSSNAKPSKEKEESQKSSANTAFRSKGRKRN